MREREQTANEGNSVDDVRCPLKQSQAEGVFSLASKDTGGSCKRICLLHQDMQVHLPVQTSVSACIGSQNIDTGPV